MKRTTLLILCSVLLTAIYAKPAKYVFYFIGDGMGANHINVTEMYLAELQGRIGNEQLFFSTFPHVGTVTTFSASNGITDSSAAGTALASGEKTKNHTLGLREDGTPVVTIAERLKEAGWAIGIMTSVSIDHATPGAFYAHVKSRNNYYDIGRRLAQTDFDFFGGGTFYQPYPKHRDEWIKQNGLQPQSLYDICREAGYTFAHGYKEYKSKGDTANKIILIQEHEGLVNDYKGTGMIPYNIDRQTGSLSLPQITTAAIDFLSKKDTSFFMMIEGGAIDWASHSNDAATAIREVLEFDESVKIAYQFYMDHPDETLILITADHETGALGMGNKTGGYNLDLQILQYQTMSLFELSNRLQSMHNEFGKKMTWTQVKDLLKQALGFYDKVEITVQEDAMLQNLFKTLKDGKNKDVKTMYKQLSTLSYEAVGLLNRKAGLSWGTPHHSASMVPIFAIGASAELFDGRQDNTDLIPKILRATELTIR